MTNPFFLIVEMYKSAEKECADLRAEVERLTTRIAELYRAQKSRVLSAKSIEYNIDELRAENERLRSALEQIASANPCDYDHSIARRALGDEHDSKNKSRSTEKTP